MQFYIETNLKECERSWKMLSPDKYFFDNWDYRLCFHKTYGNTPYFIVGYEGDELVGMIPLEYDAGYKQYLFFGGGDWNERSRFLIKPKYKQKYFNHFIDALPTKTELLYIDSGEHTFSDKLKPHELTYFSTPSDYNFDTETYLTSWSKKRRKNVRYDIKQIEKLKPTIIKDKFDDIETLIHLNRDQFKHESAFTDRWFLKTIRALITEPKLKPFLHIKTIFLDAAICTVALYAVYDNIYTFLAVGTSNSVPNIFKFLNFTLITEAFSKKAKRIDFLADECGWKDGWRLESEMLYKILT